MYGIAKDVRVVGCKYDSMDYSSAVYVAQDEKGHIARTRSVQEVKDAFKQLGYDIKLKGRR
jgi:hypothetical protein